MDRGRRAALFVVAASIGIGIAAAQVGGGSGLGTRIGPGSAGSAGSAGSDGGGSGSEAKPAGASKVESNDVPEWTAGPARFAVAPFENHTNIRALNWVTTGAPFEIAEKTEAVLGLEPTGGTLHVAPEAIPAEPGTVAAFAATRSATWVITGWYDRPNWELRLVVVLWKVNAGRASIVAESQQTGPPAT
ncbi:MAG: hypothetical protein H0T79_01515, partial [Deltaproteobacteria bacterium]|nr:hypothetical protein [Deltaproteobacteria bacterium]